MSADLPDISLAPSPQDGESAERYTIRAHKALLKSVPDAEQRNALIWSAWEHHRGELPESKIAAEKFTDDKYSTSHGHCQFVEHKTVKKDGTPHEVTARDLAAIVRQHNQEIRDVQHFPAMTNGHTADSEDGKEPAVVGHTGPFRLGMIGNENPRFAIFGDEHHRLDSTDLIAKKPFRSPEMWTFKQTGIKRFHPIAIVGAEAPRLQMPAKYTLDGSGEEIEQYAEGEFATFQHEGGEVEKYTVAAIGGEVERYDAGSACMGGGSNTFVKGPVKTKYEEDDGAEDYDQPEEPPINPTLPPDDIRAVLQALQATPQFAWITRKMEEEQAAESGIGSDLNFGEGMPGEEMPPEGMGEELPPEEPHPAAAEHERDTPAAPDTSDLDDLLGKPEEPEKHSQPSDEISSAKAKKILADNEVRGHELTPAQKGMFGAAAGKEKHSMAAIDNDLVTVEQYTEVKRENQALREKYTQLQKSHDSAMSNMKKMGDRVASMERESTDAKRKAKIDGLVSKYTLALDADDEYKVCLYSLGSKMNDAEFDAYIGRIERVGSKFTDSPMLPMGALPERYSSRAQSDVEKYDQRVNDAAVEIYTEQLGKGTQLDYDTCVAEAKKRIAAKNGHAAATA